ncbi:hypothetical protein [Saccharopolyspora sp. NPDC002578]
MPAAERLGHLARDLRGLRARLRGGREVGGEFLHLLLETVDGLALPAAQQCLGRFALGVALLPGPFGGSLQRALRVLHAPGIAVQLPLVRGELADELRGDRCHIHLFLPRVRASGRLPVP